MSDLEIRVDADEVTRALDKLDKKTSTKVIKDAVRAAGKFLKPKVKAEAPKGPTGNLRRKVGYRVKKSRQTGDTYYAAVRSFARHHHLVVQGTKDRFTKGSGAFRGRMPANPYVDRAADQYEDAAIRVAEAELVKQLDLE